MTSGKDLFWKPLPHTRKEYDQLAVSGWSWIPLERETCSSSSNKFKSLKFCVTTRVVYSFSFNWHTIDFVEKPDSSSPLASTVCPRLDCGTILPPITRTMPSKVNPHFVAVALGNRIYTIGGRTGYGLDTLYNSDVFYFDVDAPGRGWKEGPSMIIPRFKASAVVVDGKIYVFGGVKSIEEPYAEVLDPLSDKWELLPKLVRPLIPLVSVHALVSDENNSRLLLFQPSDLNTLFSYNLNTGSWDVFDEWFGDEYFGAVSAVVDGVLYCYREPCVYAYDLLKRKWFSERIRGLPRKDMLPPLHNTVNLFHIGGGRLCLFWSNISPDGRPLTMAVCTIFTVQKDYSVRSDMPDLIANIESVTRHYANGNGCSGCVAI